MMLDRLYDLGYSVTTNITEEGCIEVHVDKCSGARWVEIHWDLNGTCKVESHHGKKDIRVARRSRLYKDVDFVYDLAYRILMLNEEA